MEAITWMSHCIHCHQKEAHYTILDSKAAVCSETCLLAHLFQRVEAMSEDEAHRRLAELRAKCAVGEDGKRGGLVSEEADLFSLICQRLGIAVAWEHMNLTTGEVGEGRGQ
jgi:hypothetical protein